MLRVRTLASRLACLAVAPMALLSPAGAADSPSILPTRMAAWIEAKEEVADGPHIDAKVTFACEAKEHSAPGTYPVTPSGPPMIGQYSVFYIAGTLTVTPAAANPGGQPIGAPPGGDTPAPERLPESPPYPFVMMFKGLPPGLLELDVSAKKVAVAARETAEKLTQESQDSDHEAAWSSELAAATELGRKAWCLEPVCWSIRPSASDQTG